MIKKLIYSFLFISCAFSITFAQIPPSSVYDKEEKPLLYIPSRDYKEPQYMWGVFNDYDTKYQTRYGLSQILKTGSVYFSITQEGTENKQTHFQNEEENVKNELENALNEENRKDELSNVVKQAFKLWFTETRKAIKEAGREDEFADIIPILDRSVKAILVDYKQNRNFINFSFTTNTRMHNICDNNTRDVVAGACFNRATKEIFSPNPFTEELFYTRKALMGYLRTTTIPILAHEIGHYYGLVDQYKDFGDSNPIHKTKDRVIVGSSLMAAAANNMLYCDDIDGFINLIDITLSKQNGWSQRAKNGWASFCNGKNVPHYTQDVTYKDTFYKMGRPVKSLSENIPVASTTTQRNNNNSNNKPSSNSQIKPFTFYSSQHKYDFTYNRNDLMATKKDDKYSYRYSYYKNNGIPTIKVSAAGKEFFAVKKDRNTWELPVGYEIKEEKYNTRHYINVNANQCDIVNYIPFSDKKSYSVSYKNGKLQAEYTYSLPLGKGILELHKYETLGHPVCLVKNQYDTEIIKLVGSTFDNIEGMVGVGRNPYILDDIAQAEGKTRREIIDRLKTECRKTLHHSITTNTKELCSYFKKVDDYFNK